jgi:hypothetical protein
MVVYTYSSSTWEAEAVGLQVSPNSILTKNTIKEGK